MADIQPPQGEKQKLRCLVIDDEEIAIQGVINFIRKISFLEVAGHCSSAMEAALRLKEEDIDLMFLDINMPHLSGLEFLESLDNAPLTILTTAYSEYALDGFRLHVVDYLLKPYSFNRFFQAAQKAHDLFQSKLLIRKNEKESVSDIYIRQGETFQRICREDIVYAESMQNYLKLHLERKTFIIHQTMNSLEEMLPGDAFFRIHKSFLVNISRINTVSGNRVFIGQKELPLSKHRKEEFLSQVVYGKLISK